MKFTYTPGPKTSACTSITLVISYLLSISTILVTPVNAKKVGDICGTENDGIGVCEPTSWCKDRHGYVSGPGLCPGTADNVRCCYYPDCNAPYQRGSCWSEWQTDGVGVSCWGTYVKGYCPGPKHYKCCVPGGLKERHDQGKVERVEEVEEVE